MRPPANVVVDLWHVSHGAVVTMCDVGLPRAVWLLWQEAQFPMMPVWSMRPPANVVVDL
ncbi:MAG: hypothetical protein R3D44_13500 [Hyphomicrobiaceae bacterium]